jgi:hypothetical protein
MGGGGGAGAGARGGFYWTARALRMSYESLKRRVESAPDGAVGDRGIIRDSSKSAQRSLQRKNRAEKDFRLPIDRSNVKEYCRSE